MKKFVPALILLSAASLLTGLAIAADVNDNYIPFGTGENCSWGGSIDGNIAVMCDEMDYTIHIYDFTTGMLVGTDVDGVTEEGVYPSLSGTTFANYSYSGADHTWRIKFGDVLTGEIRDPELDTVMRPANEVPARFYDGRHVVYIDRADSALMVYSVSNDSVTDTGIVAAAPTVSGDVVAYEYTDRTTWTRYACIYRISTGTTTNLGVGTNPVVAGPIVAWMSDRSTDEELMFHRIDAGTTHATGIEGCHTLGTDGSRIAVQVGDSSIRIYDIATGTTEDTGEWGCSGGDSCWTDIEGRYVIYERYEGGCLDYSTYPRTVIYPPEEYVADDGDGGCCAGYFVSEVMTLAEALESLADQVEDLDLDTGLESRLLAKLDSAESSIADEKLETAILKIQAFINEVKAQSGKGLSSADAAALLLAADTLIIRIDS